jgi:nucleotide-binding universal stress UspA family protein
MKIILVPTDGSVAATKALDIAFDLGEKHGAKVKLLHVLLRDKEPHELLRLPELEADEDVVSELRKLSEDPVAPRSIEDVMGAPNLPERPVPDALLLTIGTSVLRRASARAKERGITAEVLDIVDGAASPAIAVAAIAESVDTIVMGMRGLRQIDAFTFGSVSQDVCRSIKCTCITVH